MGKLSTHVLDTASGKPAAGITIRLFNSSATSSLLIKTVTTNADGRVDGALLQEQDFKPGRYRLEFDVAAYFKAQSDKLASPTDQASESATASSSAIPFLDLVPIEFGIANSEQNYHIPLLISPWSYSTYRGS